MVMAWNASLWSLPRSLLLQEIPSTLYTEELRLCSPKWPAPRLMQLGVFSTQFGFTLYYAGFIGQALTMRHVTELQIQRQSQPVDSSTALTDKDATIDIVLTCGPRKWHFVAAPRDSLDVEHPRRGSPALAKLLSLAFHFDTAVAKSCDGQVHDLLNSKSPDLVLLHEETWLDGSAHDLGDRYRMSLIDLPNSLVRNALESPTHKWFRSMESRKLMAGYGTVVVCLGLVTVVFWAPVEMQRMGPTG
eukprot:gnl/MRDRNA2_/MRDRNA2_20462_c0_seq1.p1 gnl/MRDRNA2_/MRDRNA2_20462_c0~~gnl/MRDRNA2_/MRDRNA2_20462_c0_seq1.p1  ORF type:complete len:246 (-),score=35.87 gnl/MRDRNA2_/MRDRNA2_20462_c0_seq1:178-915(-)